MTISRNLARILWGITTTSDQKSTKPANSKICIKIMQQDLYVNENTYT